MNESMRVLIIGGNAVGAKAASRIRRLNPTAAITVLEQGRHISFAACGLPYHVSGKVHELEELVRTPYGRPRDVEYFQTTKAIEVRTGWRAEAIDRAARTVRARNLDTAATETFAYDKLVLATGASPVAPPVEGVDLQGVHHLTTLDEAAVLAERAREKPGSAVIVGAGFIGLEAAEALAERQWEVTVIERDDQVLPQTLDFEIAALVQEHLFEHMVELELGAQLVRIEGNDAGRVARVVTGEEEYDADLVVLAMGMRPNVELAREAGLTIGETGALAVDDHLRTSDPDIFAGGDLVENVHLVSGRKCYIPLGSPANKHGRVIGDNVCDRPTRFPGVLGTFVCKVFDYNVGSTGLSEQAAADAGLKAFSLCVPGFDKAHYYPGSEMIALKLAVEKDTGRLLGLQAAGRGDVARRIDVAATAIRFGATVDQIGELDLCYAPPYAQALDCLITAANAARNAADGLLKPVSPQATRALLEESEDVVLLDVRSSQEFAPAHIDGPKVVNIPLDDLRARLDDLPRDRKILVMCSAGLRSYTAQRLLEAAGFGDVATIEGGTFLWPWKDDLA